MTPRSPVPEPALVLRDVTMTYSAPDGSEGVPVLDGVSMLVPLGTLLAIVGPSGSGKSTLLHCAAGLEQPDSGQVIVAGTDITRLSRDRRARFRRRSIGFIFQEYNLVESLTVRENVALPLRLRGQRVPRAAVDEVLAHLGLVHRAGHRPHQLSGGEQQRVAVARALVCRPPLVLADEPTGALDISATATVLHSLRTLPGPSSAVVMVTHDAQAAAIADQVLVMGAGRVAAHLPGGSAERVADAVVAVQEKEDGFAALRSR